jgi:Tfp pilus assembly protein PilO
MPAGRKDRFWLIGGGVAAIVLLAVGWFLVIGPQRDQTNKLDSQASTATMRLSSLRAKLGQLREQDSRLPQYKAQLATDRAALPTAAALSDFLRQLQAGGDYAGVTVSGVVVGSPLEVSAASTRVYALPVTITASGSTAGLGRFLNQIQQVGARAVLIDNAAAAPDEHSVNLDGNVTLTLGVQVFIAAPADAGGGSAGSSSTTTAPN